MTEGHWSKRPVGWGQHLRDEVGERRLNPIVTDIKTVTGGILGASRTTWGNLYLLDHAPEPGSRDYERAFLLLVAVGQDPADWDIDDLLVSPLLRGARDLLVARSGCTWTTKTTRAAA